jgi:hypothetical protein
VTRTHAAELERTRADAAREREELRSAPEARAQVLEESRGELRGRAERAERDLDAVRAELARGYQEPGAAGHRDVGAAATPRAACRGLNDEAALPMVRVAGRGKLAIPAGSGASVQCRADERRRGNPSVLMTADWLVPQLGDVLIPLLGREASGCGTDPVDGRLHVRVPEPGRAVVAAAGQCVPIGAERH